MKIKTYVYAPLAVLALLATAVLAACNIGGQPCGLLNLDACNPDAGLRGRERRGRRRR